MTDKFDQAAAEFLEDAFGLEPMDDQLEIVRLANMLRAERNATLDEVETLILNRSHKGAWNTTDSGGLTKAVKGLRV